MTLSQYIALARDAVIIGILSWGVWFLYHSGENSIKLADLKAVQTQLTHNAQQVEDWKARENAAEVKHDQEVQLVATTVASQHQPVRLCHTPSASSVSHPASTPQGSNPPSRTANTGPGVDIRAAVNAFEIKYEAALADCRQTLAEWPMHQ
jgi:Tfp pilus assembly protein PilE